VNVETIGNLPFLLGQTTTPTLDRETLFKWTLWLALGFLGAFPGVVAYLVWAERKIAGRFQDRIGPNRVGPFGLLQPIADAIKLLTKESIVPKAADQWVHLLAPILCVVSSMLVLAVVPFGEGMAPVNLPSGMVYLVAISSLSPLGIFLAGWSSRNKYSLLGAMRSVAQLVSYEIPQVLATVPVVLWAGGLSLVTIRDFQQEDGWFILSPPGMLSFIILLIASLAEVNRTPFDLPEAESEIIAGYHTEYSGMRFGLFFLAEYMSVFGVSCLGTVLFLGGGSIFPFPPFSEFPKSILGTTYFSYALVNAIEIGVFTGKVTLFIFLMFWVRATLPRMRVDRLMNFAWKFLVPLSIVNIVIAAIWYELVLRPGLPFATLTVPGIGYRIPNGVVNWSVGWLVTGPITLATAWFVIWFNQRVRTASDEVPTVTHGPKVTRVVAAR
jgi:NADH-quinone oxidoreductase subunit H